MMNQRFVAGDTIQYGPTRSEMKHHGEILKIICGEHDDVGMFVEGIDNPLHPEMYLSRLDDDDVAWQVSELRPCGNDSALSPNTPVVNNDAEAREEEQDVDEKELHVGLSPDEQSVPIMEKNEEATGACDRVDEDAQVELSEKTKERNNPESAEGIEGDDSEPTVSTEDETEELLSDILLSTDDNEATATNEDINEDYLGRSDRSIISAVSSSQHYAVDEKRKNEFLDSMKSTAEHGVNNFFTLLDETQVWWNSWSSNAMTSTVAWLRLHKRGSIFKLVKATMVVAVAAVSIACSGDNKAMVRDTGRVMGQGVLLMSGDRKHLDDEDLIRRRRPLAATLDGIRMVQALDGVVLNLAQEIRSLVGDAVLTSFFS